jgi:hypothetical protein
MYTFLYPKAFWKCAQIQLVTISHCEVFFYVGRSLHEGKKLWWFFGFTHCYGTIFHSVKDKWTCYQLMTSRVPVSFLNRVPVSFLNTILKFNYAAQEGTGISFWSKTSNINYLAANPRCKTTAETNGYSLSQMTQKSTRFNRIDIESRKPTPSNTQETALYLWSSSVAGLRKI